MTIQTNKDETMTETEVKTALVLKGVTFDPAIHKVKKDGEPMVRRGAFIEDRSQAIVEPVANPLEDTEFTKDDLPDVSLEILNQHGVRINIEGHLVILSHGGRKECISLLHPDAAIQAAARRFVGTSEMSSRQLGKSEDDSGF